ncbi:GNAT family N-acetyltransferase [Methanolobus profundi]|uniref:Acetyltransferase (GNAT) domain-containing protein n=1 Tax=Methanolobus profundi TaxID=487685 RepID=A0A1I4UJ94_9EURY|nr:GNAT family N-acetyltransferase [Methanolobus profundi]SFM89057.1 Acetyltransferase (GNAT) domain-containing protein [Methanolobus profundi]
MRARILEADGLYLSNIEFTDLENIKIWRNEQMSVLRQWKPLTDRNQDKYWDVIANNNDSVLFSIIDENDRFIGYCGLTNIDYISSRGELSFLLDTDLDRNSIKHDTTLLAVLKMLSKYGFGQLNLNKVFTETYVYREEHIRTLERFGLKRDGILRKHVFKNGQYHDSMIHSMLRSEYL